MAAKVASRKRIRRADPENERYGVVCAATGRRVYAGPGVDEEEAHRLSGALLTATSVVPLGETPAEPSDYGSPDTES
jgi:hypothetical protein